MRWRRADETLTTAQLQAGYCDKSLRRVPIHILLPFTFKLSPLCKNYHVSNVIK